MRAATGEYELSEPEQFARLLVKMARNRLKLRVRRERRQVRDPAAGRQTRYARRGRGCSPVSCGSRIPQRALETVKASLTQEESRFRDAQHRDGLGRDRLALGGHHPGPPHAVQRGELNESSGNLIWWTSALSTLTLLVHVFSRVLGICLPPNHLRVRRSCCVTLSFGFHAALATVERVLHPAAYQAFRLT